MTNGTKTVSNRLLPDFQRRKRILLVINRVSRDLQEILKQGNTPKDPAPQLVTEVAQMGIPRKGHEHV